MVKFEEVLVPRVVVHIEKPSQLARVMRARFRARNEGVHRPARGSAEAVAFGLYQRVARRVRPFTVEYRPEEARLLQEWLNE